MSSLDIFYRPLLNLMVFIYETLNVGDLGLTIIIMTALIRAALLPLSMKSVRSQKALSDVAPDVERIKQQHKNDMQAQSQAIMALYREKHISPLAGCLPLLIQLPILIGMYRVFLKMFEPGSFGAINHTFIGFIDISKPSALFAIAAGVLQFIQARLMSGLQSSSPQVAALNTQMMYFFPLIIIFISWNLPAGLALYWTTTTLFSIGEQLYLRRR